MAKRQPTAASVMRKWRAAYKRASTPLEAHCTLALALHELYPEEVDPACRHRQSWSMVQLPKALKRASPSVLRDWDRAMDQLDRHWSEGRRRAATVQAQQAREEAEEARAAAFEAQGVDALGKPLRALRGRMVWLYHGTTSTKLPEILREGLRGGMPRANYGGTGNVRHGDAVFLTAQPSGKGSAWSYAQQAARKLGGEPTVLRVLVSGDELAPDRDDADISAGRYQYEVGSVAPHEIVEVDGEPTSAWKSRTKLGRR